MSITPAQFHHHECYRYARKGTRIMKYAIQPAKQANIRQNQVRYLPGLELRSEDSSIPQREILQVITINSARVLHWVQGQPTDVHNNQVRFSLNDRSHTRQSELDHEGKIISQEQYYPYGGTALWSTRHQTDANYKTLRYSGKERDVSGLLYYGYRYYAPWLMRWINPDPAGSADGFNLYAMVGNNPITWIDTDGRMRGSRQNKIGWWRRLGRAMRPNQGSAAEPARPAAPPPYTENANDPLSNYVGASSFSPPAYTPPALPSYQDDRSEAIKALGRKFQALFDRKPADNDSQGFIAVEAGLENFEKHQSYYFEKIKLQDELIRFLRQEGIRFHYSGQNRGLLGKQITVFNTHPETPKTELVEQLTTEFVYSPSPGGELQLRNTLTFDDLGSVHGAVGIRKTSYMLANQTAGEAVRCEAIIWGQLSLEIDQISLDNSPSQYKSELINIRNSIVNRAR